MDILKSVIIGFVGFIGFSSCLTPDPCANKTNLKEAMSAVVEKAKDFSDGNGDVEWSKIDEKFDRYVQQCYVNLKEEMTAAERIDFYEGVIAFSDYRDDRKYRLKRILDDANITIEGELEELGEQGAEELEKFFKDELVPELENVLDDVFSEIEKFGKELKEELQELGKDKR